MAGEVTLGLADSNGGSLPPGLVFSLKSRFSQWVTCAVNIQGALGEGPLGYKVMLITYRVCLEKAPWFSRSESFWSW